MRTRFPRKLADTTTANCTSSVIALLYLEGILNTEAKGDSSRMFPATTKIRRGWFSLMLRKTATLSLLIAVVAMVMAGCGPAEGRPARVFGFVYDQVTGDPLGGVFVSCGIDTTYTSNNGSYSLIVDSGAHTLMFSLYGYVYESINITVWSGANVTLDPMPLLPELPPGPIQFCLTWEAYPPDLDAHLWNPGKWHVYHSDRGSLAGPPYASLDYDCQNGYGPETITIADLTSGTYHYAVNNSSSSYALAGCGAQVVISAGSRGWLAIVPSGGSPTDIWWDVVEIDAATRGLRRVMTLSPGSASASLESMVWDKAVAEPSGFNDIGGPRPDYGVAAATDMRIICETPPQFAPKK